ncbi:hypothetical protein BC834DRAFT_965921 [Gloeopeniophorella convolvens]|nr:hypothetical protein BC834DRAFT_965921 [Gloeopeniophorella convolvens]
MRSSGLVSFLALVALATGSPISHVRRASSLIPTPPPACVGKVSSVASSNTTTLDPPSASNTTTLDPSAASNTTTLDPSSASNVTSSANTTTTTTCLFPASALPNLANATDITNSTLGGNCTNVSNSTSLSGSGNSTDLTPPSDTDTSNTSDSSDSSDSNDSGDSSTSDDTSDTNDSSDTSDSNDSGADTSDTDTADDSTPPPPPPPPPSSSGSSESDGGSAGILDPSSGELTADTSDPDGRRRRSFVPRWLRTHVPHSSRSSMYRRIAQDDLPAVAQNWQDLCLASGGDIFTNDPCVQLAGVAGINALLATGGVCDQQDNADSMIDFAKSTGVTNGPALIAAAVAYRKHPRNAEDIGGGVVPSTFYCTKAPRNQELVGVFNDQLPGVDPGLFGGPNADIVAFGEDGTCPAGQTPDVSTCSCT